MRKHRNHGRSLCWTCLRECCRSSSRIVTLAAPGSWMMCVITHTKHWQPSAAAWRCGDCWRTSLFAVSRAPNKLYLFRLHRTGICLPFVCKAFRSALLDLQHARLWATVAPLRCVEQRSLDDGATITRKWKLSLQQWVQARAAAMRVLHIRWAQAALQ